MTDKSTPGNAAPKRMSVAAIQRDVLGPGDWKADTKRAIASSVIYLRQFDGADDDSIVSMLSGIVGAIRDEYGD